jgi:hypothetical protein
MARDRVEKSKPREHVANPWSIRLTPSLKPAIGLTEVVQGDVGGEPRRPWLWPAVYAGERCQPLGDQGHGKHCGEHGAHVSGMIDQRKPPSASGDASPGSSFPHGVPSITHPFETGPW